MEELQPIWDAFYVFRAEIESESESGYLMEHSARAIVVDKFGNFRLTFPFGMSAEAISEDISNLLNE